MKKKQSTIKTAAEERVIRTDKKLTPTWKVYWLLTSLSGEGYSYMSEEKMASQLNITDQQVCNSLAILEPIILDYFQKKRPPGIHRVNQWHRQYLPKEQPHEFVKRAQLHPKMDVCVGLHWIAIDQVKDTGEAEFSARGLWPKSDEALRQARVKMNRLGWFKVESARETGKPARYILNEARFAAAEEDTHKRVQQVKPVERVEPKPTSTWAAKQEKKVAEEAAKQDQARRLREREAEEIARREAESRQKLAEAVGVTLEGEERHAIYVRPGVGTKSGKRIIRFEPSGKKAKAEIDENDL